MGLQFCVTELRGEEAWRPAAALTHEGPSGTQLMERSRPNLRTADLTYISISFSLRGILPLKHQHGSPQGESVQVPMCEDCTCRLLNLSQGSCILTLGGVHRSNTEVLFMHSTVLHRDHFSCPHFSCPASTTLDFNNKCQEH